MRIKEPHKILQGSVLRDFILGWQDGLVNVLGILLGVSVATNSLKIILVSGLAATFAESISMAAVSYTSSKATRDFYLGEMRKENEEIEKIPLMEKKEISDIYRKKGFKGALLTKIVDHITSNKKVWLKIMMEEELGLSPVGYENPARNAALVGLSAIIGSIIPLIPFAFAVPSSAIFISVILSAIVLFAVGIMKAKMTIGDWKRSGIELALIGILAAIAGYLVGIFFGVLNI
jgi:VIT1/CCC1 family predicted Fe2+/Mn2+ transporter